MPLPEEIGQRHFCFAKKEHSRSVKAEKLCSFFYGSLL